MMIAAAAALVAVAACSSSAHDDAAKLPDLSGSLDGVRAEFNAHKQEARFLTLLAPT
jgi:hypothetical protein